MEIITGSYLTYQEHYCTGSTPVFKKPSPGFLKNKWFIPHSLLYREKPYSEVQLQRQKCSYLLSLSGIALIRTGELIIQLTELDPETYITKFDPIVIGIREFSNGNIVKVNDFSLTIRLYEIVEKQGHNLHLRGLPPAEDIFD